MKKRININDVGKFWNWFEENCQKFGDKFENTALLGELDLWINKLGNFTWEVGPGKICNNALVISPNGDRELLQDTKKIINSASSCIDWEFYYAKPPKKWDLKFDFIINNGQTVHIDASHWKYCLMEYDDGMFAVIIKMQKLENLDDAEKLSVAEIVLDGILGEEKRIMLIATVDVVNEFEEALVGKENDISELSEHFSSLKNP